MSLSNKTSKELLALTKRFIPPLLPHFHKGQAGRIAVIGGCEDYTGAPFFSSHASALMGCDMAHVICEKLAAPIIKTYSPDLMVHPYLFEEANVPESYAGKEDAFLEEKILPKVESVLKRIHVVVVGPGFGRDPLMLKSLHKIVELLIRRDIPIVLDADSLYLVSQYPDLIKGYDKAIITPNVVEFQRIADALGVKVEDKSSDSAARAISKALGNVTVLQKGAEDLIVRGDNVVAVKGITGSPKRVGGQGDSLTGCIATLLAWSFASYKQNLWDHSGHQQLTDEELIVLSCYSGMYVVRTSARKAFEKYGRSMQTSHIHEFIGAVYNETFGVDVEN